MLTASVVTFHTSRSDLKRLIDCVLQSPIDVFFIIDNSSNDSLREFASLSDRIVYIYSDNLGFGSGHNIAVRRTIELGAQYHAVINPDIYWTGDAVTPLVDFMDKHGDCGLVMPKVLYPNGDIQYLCKLLPTPMDLFGRRFVPLKAYRKRHDRHFELHRSGYDKVMEIPSLSGCFMFMRVETLRRTGGFDERFFMYAEDLDLCRRIGEVSKTMFYPGVSIYHEYEKGSYKNWKLLRYHICSVVKYFNKWGWMFDAKRTRMNRKCMEQLGAC
ncbi:glycosyltransferase [uncultured Bacteroides sp.]|uniref:glycosyltransferase n=1 Tax=uncultured Bacteroides sp. TaxID=162156 RepID=UPI0025D25773|nr:glycosyltransferase family 2 protein [uncultured Bacteroides sp.]